MMALLPVSLVACEEKKRTVSITASKNTDTAVSDRKVEQNSRGRKQEEDTYLLINTGNARSNAPFPAAEAGSVPVSSMEVKTAWMASPGDLTVH